MDQILNSTKITYQMREDGYYWVKYTDIWRIAEWDKTAAGFHVFGWTRLYKETEFDEINENRIVNPLGE